MKLIGLYAHFDQVEDSDRFHVKFSTTDHILDEVILCLDANESWALKQKEIPHHRIFLKDDETYLGFKFQIIGDAMYNLTFFMSSHLIGSKLNIKTVYEVYDKCITIFPDWVASGVHPKDILIPSTEERLRLKYIVESKQLSPSDQVVAEHFLSINPMNKAQKLVYERNITPLMYPICKNCSANRVVLASTMAKKKKQLCEQCYEELPDSMKDQPETMIGF